MKEDEPQKPWSLRHWSLVAAVVVTLGALCAYVITRDSQVLSWAALLVGPALAGRLGPGSKPNHEKG